MKDITDVVDEYSGNSRKVLEYGLLMKRMVDEAKQPGFSAASWDVLLDLIAADDFVRVGNFKETQDWAGYVEFLTAWAPNAEWECSFKQITEVDGRVFLELEERSRMGDFSSVVNSMSVYEFGADGKIHHLDVYLQMPPV
ncbi:MAG: hypothetical protein U0W40_14165 [Acidimicrobiia bacterium]